jgi:predicted RNase H-like nuclease (RuvC/YqgF family)
MSIESEDFMDWADGAQRELERRLERMREEEKEVDNYLMAIEVARKLMSENEKQTAEIESLREQLQEEKRLRAEMEMKMAEMSKLSAGMAKKSSEEDLLKALRTYANRSKRKTLDKRTFAKSAILEIANVNNLTLPEDLATTVESLDDEQAEPKIVIETAGDVIAEGGVKNVKNTRDD